MIVVMFGIIGDSVVGCGDWSYRSYQVSVNRDFWSGDTFSQEYVTPWPCPTCQHGVLALKEGSLQEEATGQTACHERDDNWEPDFWGGRFSCFLVCRNVHCRDCVAVLGDAFVEQAGEYGNLITVYRPRMFAPALHIFNIPPQCPADVQGEIIAAFQLFWCDPEAAMNHARKAVEMVLTHLGVKRFELSSTAAKATGKKKRIFVALHNRIGILRRTQPEIADRLEAVKWIGNVGSHSKGITKDDLFDSFDLIEDVLQEHFEKRGDRIRAISTSIIKRRGPRSH